jgi:hypothetical protein
MIIDTEVAVIRKMQRATNTLNLDEGEQQYKNYN